LAVRPTVLETLLAALACEGVLEYDRAAGTYATVHTPASRPDIPHTGLGCLADVVRGTVSPSGTAFSGVADVGPLHEHLFRVGLPVAARMWQTLRVTGGRLLDVGCGAGAYAAAYLEKHPGASATLVDNVGALEMAQRRLAAYKDRVRFETRDALVSLPRDHDVVLMANLLHLHDADRARTLLANAYDGLRPGGRLIIKDMWMDDDRLGPAVALYFALTLAVYTEGGDVHERRRVCRWAVEQGFTDVVARQFESSLLVTGMR